jgi:hypothetical protein
MPFWSRQRNNQSCAPVPLNGVVLYQCVAVPLRLTDCEPVEFSLVGSLDW